MERNDIPMPFCKNSIVDSLLNRCLSGFNAGKVEYVYDQMFDQAAFLAESLLDLEAGPRVRSPFGHNIDVVSELVPLGG